MIFIGKKTSSRFLQSFQFGPLYIESLDTDELDYNVDGLMFCKILSALKHNDKVKRLFLSSLVINPASFGISGLKIVILIPLQTWTPFILQ